MTRKITLFLAAMIAALLIFYPAVAQADDPPLVENITATGINNSGATISAGIYPQGAQNIIADVAYGTTPTPDGSWQTTNSSGGLNLLPGWPGYVTYEQTISGNAPGTQVYYQIQLAVEDMSGNWYEEDTPVQSFTTTVQPTITDASVAPGPYSAVLTANVDTYGVSGKYRVLYGNSSASLNQQTDFINFSGSADPIPVSVTIPQTGSFNPSSDYAAQLEVQTDQGAIQDSTVVSFTTPSDPSPIIAPGSAFAGTITRTSATLLAQVNTRGETGTAYWAYGTVPGIYTVQSSPQALSTSNNYQTAQAQISGLSGGVTYYSKLFVSTDLGSKSSDEISFSTPAATAPQFQSLVSYPTGASSGSVSVSFLANGAATTCSAAIVSDALYQQNGYANAQTAPCSPASQAGEGSLSAKADFTNLSATTSYHIRMTLSNSAGTQSQEGTLVTNAAAPTIANLAVTEISQSGATISADIDDDGQAASVGLAYGPNSSYGSNLAPVYIPASDSPQHVSFQPAGLNADSSYQFQLAVGTAQQAVTVTGSFTTLAAAPGAPQVLIYSHPKPEGNSTTARFTFSGLNAASYQCQVDLGGWKPCDANSGVTLHNVSVGDHMFQVRAYNSAGQSSQASVAYWTVYGPAQCVLQVARARDNISAVNNTVTQVIKYKSRKPATITVKNVVVVGHGSKAKRITLPQAGAHFKKRGLYKNTLNLTAQTMQQVRHATGSRVILHVAGAPNSCNSSNSRTLDVVKTLGSKAKTASKKAVQLFQSDSVFLPGAADK